MQPEQNPTTQQQPEQQVQQPENYQTQAAPVQPVGPSTEVDQDTSWYISNPYLNSVRGIVLILKHNPVSIMLSGLVGLLIFIAVGVVSLLYTFATGYQSQNSLSSFVPSLIFLLVSLVIGLVLVGSYAIIAGKSANEEKITTKESYKQAFKRFLPSLALAIIWSILYLLLSLLLILPGIYFAARASLSLIVMYQEGLGPIAAIKRSFILTKGHVIEMLGAITASLVISGGGSGLLTGALSLAPLVGRYNDLKKLKESGAPKPKIHYLNWVTIGVLVLFIVGYFGTIGFLAYSSINGIQTKARNDNLTNFNNGSFNSTLDSNSGGPSYNSGTPSSLMAN